MDYKYEKLSKEQAKSVIFNLRYCDLRITDNKNQIVVPVYYTLKHKDNNLIFYLTGKLDDKKVKLLNENPIVSLGFVELNNKKVKTVIVIGAVENVLYKNSSTSAKITVCAKEFSGRGYNR